MVLIQDIIKKELDSCSNLEGFDETVLDYIIAMSEEWCQSGEESDELVEMILPFLLESSMESDVAETLCRRMATLLSESGCFSKKTTPREVTQLRQVYAEVPSKEMTDRCRIVEDVKISNIEKEKEHTSSDKTEPTLEDIDEEQLTALEDLDDFGSAWAECRATGRKWGGRGFGGRGVNRTYQCMSENTRDVCVDGVTLAYQGKDLLQRTVLRITAGRKYALLGMNGVGKSTLLRRIAAGMVPGFPPHLRIAYLSQEHKATPPDDTRTALEAVVAKSSGTTRAILESEMEELEELLTSNDENIEEIAERLSEIQGELDELDGPQVQLEAQTFLKGLGFDKQRLSTPEAKLSGGWRMRVEIAATLLQKADILLLDEPTNHLDLHGILWLEATLKEMSGTSLVLVSHDRFFVSAVATDIILFENQQLRYFPGDYEAFLEAEANTEARQLQLLDSRTRQEEKARASAEALKAKAKAKGGGDKELKAAKQRLAKVERIGLYRDDGKKFKLMSMSKLDESALRLPSRIEVSNLKRDKETSFKFPGSNSGGEVCRMSNTESVLTLDETNIGYSASDPVLKNITAQLTLKSRVAVVGPNGAGKTTLLKVLHDNSLVLGGKVTRHSSLRVAIVAQNHVDVLKPHMRISATALIVKTFHCNDLEARSALGKFGLSGKYALQPLGTLSGGQKVRVSLAMVTWHHPQILLLDEPTNHMDVPALQALVNAVSDFDGAIVVVSHNRAFVASVCKDLWIVEGGKVDIRLGNEDSTFSDLFSDYCDGVLSQSGQGSKRSAANKASARAERNVKSGSSNKQRGAANKQGAGAGAARTALM